MVGWSSGVDATSKEGSSVGSAATSYFPSLAFST